MLPTTTLLRRRRCLLRALLLPAGALLLSAGAEAQTIKGTITSASGTLPGATVTAQDRTIASNLEGVFTLTAADTGRVQLTVSYMGFETRLLDVEVRPGVTDLGNITLEAERGGNLGEVVVSGTMAPSQAKAYSIKRNSNAIMDVLAADAIGKLPDRNAAEAVQRMQGVAVARYHGEADQATVRGTPFAWTSTLFNGSRLPSSNVVGNRSSVLDVVPSEMIQYVQVAKAITPDMEGDAIGGSVNFITRTAPAGRQLAVSAAAGYNTFSRNATYNGSLVYGDRFFNNRLGIIVAGAIWNRQWGSDAFDVSYNTGLPKEEQRRSINSVMFKRYMGTRQTMGLNAGAEYKLAAVHKLFFRGMANKFNDIRPVYESYVDYNNSRYHYNYRYSHYQTRLNGLEIGGEHVLATGLKLEWGASDYQAKYFLETPPTNGTKGLPIATFRQKISSGFGNLSADGKRYWGFDSPNGVGGDPMDFSAGVNNPDEVLDPQKLLLSQLVIAQLDNSERDRIGQLNLKYEASPKLRFKVGGKYRHKERTSTYGSNIVYLPGAALGLPNAPALLNLAQLGTTEFPSGSDYFGAMRGNHDQYVVNPLTKDQLFNMYGPEFLAQNGFVEATSKTNSTNLYTGTEDVIAGYAMAEFEASQQLKIVGGLRNEYTRMQLDGTRASTAGTPAKTALSPSTTRNNYNALLPMLHLKYAVNEHANLRAAFTRTFIRPNFGDMSPGTAMDATRTPMTITQGNPLLRPTFSNNYDLMGEYFFSNIGLLSGGLFYKDISDVVFTDISMQQVDGSDYLVTQAKNLNKAQLFGFEAGINKRLNFLKGFWSGFGVEFNYTFIDSRVEVPRGTGAARVLDKTSLPNQSKHLFNAILFYERNGVMVRLAGNFRGASVETINQQLGPDYYTWTDRNFTVDASATVAISRKLRAFVELNNLTNEPIRMYMGDSRRLSSAEWYGGRGQAGIRWDIIK